MTLHDPLIPEKETALHAHDLLDSLAGKADARRAILAGGAD